MTKEEKNETAIKNETAEVKSKPQKASKSKKKGTWLYLIFMLLLAAGSGVAVYYTTPLVLASLAPQKPLIIKTVPQAKAHEAPVVKTEPVDKPIFEDISLVQEEPIAEQEVEVVLPEIHIEEQFVPPEVSGSVMFQPEPVPQPAPVQQPAPRKPVNYSVLKAIELRDAFKNGGECRPLLEELVAMPNKTPEMDQALMELLRTCLERPIAGQMQQAFHAAKKRAILRIFQANYPTYLAYLKALPYFLANIRKKNPTEDTPMDILDRIQIAVDDDRPQLVLKLIPKLPENVQATLNDVTQCAEAESALYKTLNQLMKALFDGEER